MSREENGARWISGRGLALVGLIVTGACVERPSEDECRAMADHIVELERARFHGRAAELAADVAQQHHHALRSTCLDAGTPDEVRCVIAAESLDAVTRCARR